MKKLLLYILFPVSLAAFNPVQNDRGYQVHMDLTIILEDKIRVSVVVPVLEEDEVIYNMPKIVPGTYKIYDYGNFVHKIKALNSSGEELKIEQINTNQWRILDAKELYKIEYWVSDSYHNDASKIFEPAGTAISSDAFLLNNFGFIGYLENYKDLPFQLEVKKQKHLYGVTSLEVKERTDYLDVFTAENYFNLHDCPILYARPDTASVNVAGIPITIGVYSHEGHIKAATVLEALKPVFEAAASYLGGTLPAEKYTVIIYGLSLRKSMNGTGALEHHTSTVVNMPDVKPEYLKMFTAGDDEMQIYRDMVAHEFFHIVTPLNIHARQISDYDFINPQMSDHLWLYEGITEYNAMLAQVKGGIISFEEFMDEVQFKMEMSRDYDQDIPFTQMSRYALSFYGDQYHNVYLKGALIGLSVDLKLRQLSDGKTGLIDLLEDMWQTYGADTFFVDDDLFRILAEKSYPEMEEFLVSHIAGTKPLPLEELLAEVGIEYFQKREVETVNFGNIQLQPSRARKGFVIIDFDDDSEFIRKMGIEKGDVLKEINGQKISMHGAASTILEIQEGLKEGDQVEFVIMRKTSQDESKKMKLKSRAVKSLQTEYDHLSINENLTDNQRTLRDLWIN